MQKHFALQCVCEMQILKVIAPVSLQNKFCKYTSQTHWSLCLTLKPTAHSSTFGFPTAQIQR